MKERLGTPTGRRRQPPPSCRQAPAPRAGRDPPALFVAAVAHAQALPATPGMPRPTARAGRPHRSRYRFTLLPTPLSTQRRRSAKATVSAAATNTGALLGGTSGRHRVPRLGRDSQRPPATPPRLPPPAPSPSRRNLVRSQATASTTTIEKRRPELGPRRGRRGRAMAASRKGCPSRLPVVAVAASTAPL